MKIVTQALTILLLAACTSAAVAKEAEPVLDLSGTWQLNEELSEDPREKMRDAMGERGGFGGGGPGGRGGGLGGGRGGLGGGGRPGGGGGTGSRSGGDPRERMAAMAESYRSLTIRHAEPELRVTFADDRELLIYTDGRTTEGELGSLEAKWKKGSRLVVTARSDRGKRIETWELSEDGSRLTIATESSGGGRMPAIEFRRVYDLGVRTEDS